MSTEAWIVVVVAGVLVLATVVLAVRLLVRLVRARGLLRDAGVPVQNKAVFWGAVLYLVSPVDLLPDPVYLDDIGILLLALRSLHAAAASAGLRTRRD
ncbi:YkvA family protein [Streptomyces sp. NPDC053542]|uniref:YkvA family protein n=1 Tax=Streptomyces sp. NPDC053542 TaxID=3365710 RepID=UPI0037CFF9A2